MATTDFEHANSQLKLVHKQTAGANESESFLSSIEPQPYLLHVLLSIHQL